MAVNINIQFDDFGALLESQKRAITVGIGDSRIAKTVQWLLNVQHADGAWGNADVATTAITIIALSDLSEASGTAELRLIVGTAIEKAGSFLSSKFELNRWEDALWDTSIAVRALHRLRDERHAQLIKSRVQWLISASEHRGNHGPHHIAQCLIALSDMSVHRDLLLARANLLCDHVSDQFTSYSPYVIGQCVEALCRIQTCPEVVAVACTHLRSYISSVRLDYANFINICQSLQALWIAPGKENIHTARVGTASLFGSTCFRDSGSWYNSEFSTAWRLLTLTRFSEELVVRIPYSELVFEYTQLRRAHDDYALNERRKTRHMLALHIAAAAVWAGLIVFFVYYTTRNDDMYEWAKWVIWALIATLFAFNMRPLVEGVIKER